jgi:hypothetical protein
MPEVASANAPSSKLKATAPTALEALRSYFKAWHKQDPSLKPYVQSEQAQEEIKQEPT